MVSRHWQVYQEAKEHNRSDGFQAAYARRGRIESKVWELVHHGCRRCRYLGNLKSRVQLWLAVVAVNAKRILCLLQGLGAPPLAARGQCAPEAA
jgi:hypothetical protein